MTKPQRTLLYSLVLVVAGILAYAGSFGGPFVYDDLTGIVQNESLARLSDSFSPPQDTTLAGRPVLSVSFWLNHAFGGLDPTGYHGLNLVIHLLGGLLLFGLARRVLTSDVFGESTRAASAGLALCVTAAWMLHPLQTQSVTYIVQRAESLMGLFFLATLYCSWRSFEGPRAGAWAAGAVLASALGMATKEVMVAAPLVVLALDWSMRPGSLREKLAANKSLYAGLFATYAILAACVATTPRAQSVGFDLDMSAWTYLLTQTGVLVHYLRLAVYPEPQSFDYFDWPLAQGVSDVLLPAAVIVLLLAASAWALLRRKPIGLLGALFFLVLAPTSSVLPIVTEIAAEHRMYLALIAPVAVLVVGIHAQLARRSLAPAGPYVAVFALVALGLLTYRRNQVYASPITLWQDVLDSRPDNARAHSSLGLALHEAEQTPAALPHCQRAVELAPTDPDNRLNLGTVLNALGRFCEAETTMRPGLERHADDAALWSALGAALAQQGKQAEALEALQRAAELEPDTPGLQANLAAARLMNGNYADAVTAGRLAVEHDSKNAQAYHNLAQALLQTGDTAGAVKEWERAATLEPNSAKRQRALAQGLMQAGRLEEALTSYRAALAIEFDVDDANTTARILATHPDAGLRDGAQAVELAERMLREAGDEDPLLLDTLGTAYAETARFEDAVRVTTRALQLPLPEGMQALAAGMRARLELYQARKPYRF